MSLITAMGGVVFGWTRYFGQRGSIERYAITGVRRTTLDPTLVASGRVASAKQTEIQCQLENLSVGVKGQRLGASGASTLIRLIPDGSVVNRGDVLAVLDSSDYEELVRLQQITVERAKADKLQAQLDYEIAKMAVLEFREGAMQQTIQDFQGRISLARSDLERARDRMNWSRSMKDKGYVSLSAVRTDEHTVAQMEEVLRKEESAYEVFRKYSAPKTLRELQGAVLGAGATLNYQRLRCQRHIGRLAMLEKQIAACTIRAPHDGMVIYANDPRREIDIEEGMSVRQNQRLFYLPDLNDMEIVVQLHESIVQDVRPGMQARVQVEGLPGRELEGRVKSISPLPTFEWRTDVRYFDAIVKVDKVLPGLLPGMTAQVEVVMPRRENVLAVPTESVASAEGHNVCFVVHDEKLERREVKLGPATHVMTEVIDGLREGEQIVLNPNDEEAELEDLIDPAEVASASASSPHDEASSGGDVAALH